VITVREMHYARFLKPPRLGRSVQPSKKHDLELKAKITITTDLGESFLCKDVRIVVFLEALNGDGEERGVESRKMYEYMWKGGMRSLEITFPVVGVEKSRKYSGSDNPSLWPCCLVVRAVASGVNVDSLQRLLANDVEGGIVPLRSEALDGKETSQIARRVQRVFTARNHLPVRIWEETGESIARHIWDAGLVLSSYLSNSASDSSSVSRPLKCIFTSHEFNVLELGAGCGIVGITLAQHFIAANVVLTDLPEAEEILKLNISRCQEQNAKSEFAVRNGYYPGTIAYQSLDWSSPLPENIVNGFWSLILVADCTYNADVVPDLVKTLSGIVGVGWNRQAVILLAMKVRHESEKIFFDLMEEENFAIKDRFKISLPVLGMEDEEIEGFVFQRRGV